MSSHPPQSSDGLSPTCAAPQEQDYRSGSATPSERSPRTFLHPVRSPAGIVLTEIEPEDHPHHYGLSAAIADVSGTNHWGGRSYVDGEGYRWLDDHGAQRSSGTPEIRTAPGHLEVEDQVRWIARDGVEQAREERTVRVRVAQHDLGPVTLVHWRTRLRATTDLLLGSPATRGRVGAGYGGLFWRVGPEHPTEVLAPGPDGPRTGEEAALGTRAPWLALGQTRATGAGPSPVLLVLGQPADHRLPWFVRTTGYVGAGPAVAWSEPDPILSGQIRELSLWGAIMDLPLDPAGHDRALPHTLYRLLEDTAP